MRASPMSPEAQVLVEMATRSFSVAGDGEVGWNVLTIDDGGQGWRYATVDELVFALINLSCGVEGSA